MTSNDNKLITKTVSFEGVFRGFDNYGKLVLEIEPAGVDFSIKQPLFKKDNKLHRKINLGMLSFDEKLMGELKLLTDQRIVVKATEKSYDSPQFGQGIYHTLISASALYAL
jgi:hypothetical protein